MAKDKGTKKGSSGDSKATPKERPLSIEEAKKAFDEAKKKVLDLKAGIRRNERLIKSAPKKTERLKEQIAKAKAKTTHSADELAKRTEALLKEAAELSKAAKETDEKATRAGREIDGLQMELREIRVAQGRKVSTTDGKSSRPGPSKIGMAKALKRRKFMSQNKGEELIGMAKEDLGIQVTFGEEKFTVQVKGKEPIERHFGQGQVKLIDQIIKAQEKAKAESEANEAKSAAK